MNQNVTVLLNVPLELEKNVIYCCVGYSINVKSIKWLASASQVIYILTDFLPV